MGVSVSIVTYQNAAHLDACLAALRAQTARVSEVLLADNGSLDGAVARARARHPEVRVLEMGRNAGYAAAHNRNFARSAGEFFLALNPDVVLAPDYLSALLARFAEDPRLASATGLLVQPGVPARVDSAGITYTPTRSRFVDRGHGAPPARFAREADVLGACGAAALYRRAALASVSRSGESPFAERFFMYYEDVDLAWRLRRAGWRARYCPTARARHVRGGSGASAAFVEYHLVRNRLWVSLRNASARELLAELPGMALFAGAKLVQSAWRPHLRAALRAGARGIPISIAERRPVEAGR